MTLCGLCHECFSIVPLTEATEIVLETAGFYIDTKYFEVFPDPAKRNRTNVSGIYECPHCDYPNSLTDFHLLFSIVIPPMVHYYRET